MMRDERVEMLNARIKRTIFFSWIILAFLSISLKLGLSNFRLSLFNILPEIVALLGSLIAIIIQIGISYDKDIVDERILKMTDSVSQRSFIWIIVLTYAAYTVQVMNLLGGTGTFDNSSLLSGGLTPNFFISFAMLVTFIVYYVKARREGVYVNYKSLSLETAKYTSHYFQFILFILGIVILYGIAGYLLGLLAFPNTSLITLAIILFVSWLGFAFDYAILTVFERWKYKEELEEEEKNLVPLVSKTAVIFFFLVVVFKVYASVIFNLNYYFANAGSSWSILFQFLYVLTNIQSIHFFIFTIIGFLVIFSSLKKAFPRRRQSLYWISIAYFTLLGAGEIFYLFGVFVFPIISHSLNNLGLVQQLAINMSKISFGILILNGSFLIFVIILLFLNKLYVRWIALALLIAKIIQFILNIKLPTWIFSDATTTVFLATGITAVLVAVLTVGLLLRIAKEKIPLQGSYSEDLSIKSS